MYHKHFKPVLLSYLHHLTERVQTITNILWAYINYVGASWHVMGIVSVKALDTRHLKVTANDQ